MGDSALEQVTIYNHGVNDLVIDANGIGGGGIDVQDTLYYNTDGATTVHNFPGLNGAGIDTLWIWVGVNGDYDNNGEDADVFVEGIFLGQVGINNLFTGTTDSSVFFLTGNNLTTVMADGQVDVNVVNDPSVGTFVGTEWHSVRVFAAGNGAGWIGGTIPGTTVPFNDSTVLDVNISSFGLYAGTHYTEFVITSNDPVFPDLSVPIVLDLVGTAAYTIDSCFDFGTTVVGVPVVDSFYYVNTGCDTLEINGTSFGSTDYTLNSITGDLLPGETGVIQITFNPATIGTSNTTFDFLNNVLDTTICVLGAGQNIVSEFTPSDQHSCTAQITFTDESIGTITSYDWDFGDGNSSTQASPSHYYNAPRDLYSNIDSVWSIGL